MWPESYSTFKSSLLLWAQAAWNRPWVFQISFLHDTNILSESNAATSNKTATRSTEALLASKEEKLNSFSLPVVSNGEGSNEQNPTLSGSLSWWRGSFWAACTLPQLMQSVLFPLLFHCWASFSQQFPENSRGSHPPPVCCMQPRAEPVGITQTQSLCGLSLRGRSLFVWPPGVLQNNLSEESLDHKGQPFPSPLLNQHHQMDGTPPSNASLPSCPGSQLTMWEAQLNIHKCQGCSHIHWDTRAEIHTLLCGGGYLATREGQTEREGEMTGGRAGNQVQVWGAHSCKEQFPTEMLALGVPINPVVCNGILLVAIQLQRSSKHHPQGKTWGQGLTIITLLILALTRQPVSAPGRGDCPSESILTLKPLQHEGQPEVWKGCSHCA